MPAPDSFYIYFSSISTKRTKNTESPKTDCGEIYAYWVLFGDLYDNEKYVTTSKKLCRTGFAMFEDSANDDTRNATPMCEESSDSNDEGDKFDRPASSMDVSGRRSGKKCRFDGSKKHSS
ncbi:uncharacterized protein LOC111383442 [Olea europaea var. sylvestris]|uniref:uncharacterized protein LOC111383442 n=1 Tax=Olea europaea var. sylvestris TaxID=158386 RepID=UPI000C1D41FB|nr:uncharacterized protein LOC111383442 [Olea europaea var. sylvestris]